jgi:hypothetical protein
MNSNPSVDIVYLLHREYGNFSNAVNFFSNIDIESFNRKYSVNLICLVKGDFNPKELTEAGYNFKVLRVPNTGRDIYSYYYYATYLSKSDFLFYFNTGSIVLGTQFVLTCLNEVSLNPLNAYAATGSYGSIIASNYFISLGPSLTSFGEKFINNVKIIYCKFIEYLFGILGVSFIPHIRTNAFIISRGMFLNSFKEFFYGAPPKSRLFSLLYESSSSGLSGHIIRKGGRILVVGFNSIIYEHNDWLMSATYCSLDQSNLAVHDNRTKEFEFSPPRDKYKLYIGAWGPLL